MLSPNHHAGAASAISLGPVLHRDGSSGAQRVLAGSWLRAAHGRWVLLRLAAAAVAAHVRVELRSASPRWPTMSQQLTASGGELHAWLFVLPNSGGVLFSGPAAVLADLELLGTTVHEAAPDGAQLAPAMRSAADLHALGVRELHQVEFTGDPQWPLIATGADPQLRFQRLGRGGHLQVQLALRREAADAPAPVLYWTDGRGGFGDERSRPLDGQAGRWTAELQTMRKGVRWRLDPLERPGRFALDAVALEFRQPALMPLRRALDAGAQWLQAFKLRHCETALQPVHELEPLLHDPRRFHASGHDPHFRLAATLAAGWYMAEIALDLPCVRHRARFYLDDGRGETEDAAWTLPLRTGQVAKRLLWVHERSRLRLDPMSMPGEFGVRHFRLKRVSARFARDRMLRKLRSAQTLSGGQAEPAADSLEDLWRRYCHGFEPHHEGNVSYAEWIEQVERPALPSTGEQARRIADWAWRPLISILTPTFNTPPALLRECLDSVLAQSYPHWQLCVADDASTEPAVRAVLREYAARDSRIHLALRERNGHIAEASNTALQMATGDFVALLDHDDRLAPHALFAVAQALQQQPGAQIVYSDEDKLDAEGERCEPFFKPGWSPDLLRSQNYISHLGVYRTSLVHEVGGFRTGFVGSQDYDLLLRCAGRIEDVADVMHVPQVLYHWRKAEGSTALGHGQKNYASEAALRALQEHADREGRGVRMSAVAPGLYRAHWPLPEPAPLVSLIIPTRDGLEVLRQCIDSVVHCTIYPNYEILVVDNQSTDPATLAYLDELPERLDSQRVRVLRWDHPFNYSAINNFAASQARGSVLGLVNNDVEVIRADWLGEMVSHALRPEVGCVGAKLYYPDDTLQHAGVVLGIGGVAGHSHKYFPRDAEGYFSRLRIVHNVSAVTGAVLLLRRSVFEQVGGLDEKELHVAFNDVDLCLKVRAAGYLNVWTPFAELYHHESKTRGDDIAPEKRKRFERECEVMLRRWGDLLSNDPYYHPQLSRLREDYSLGTAPPMNEQRPNQTSTSPNPTSILL